jgi:alpha-amylase
LRNAVYNHLIAADNLLDHVQDKPVSSVEGTAADFDFDARPEVQLRNSKLVCLMAPNQGGQLYELDVRTICHNLGATLTRRPEAYHRKVLAGHAEQHGHVESIHDRVVFKQEHLDRRVQYDSYPRKSLIDHFFTAGTTVDQLAHGEARQAGDFVQASYEARLRRSPDRVQVQMWREGQVGTHRVKLTKGVTIQAERSQLEIVYLLENLPADATFHFGVEFNFAGLPAAADGRYFQQGSNRLGHLGSQLTLTDIAELNLVDEWLGLKVQLQMNQPTGLWAFPIETVSQSEAGFELVHQAVAVLPHWQVRGDEHGRWTVTLLLDLDTRLAESRMEATTAIATH